MRVETNKAWGEAVQLVSGNREALWALAGVFFVLPSFLFAVVNAQPETPPGATPAELFAMLGEFYRQAWPLMLLSTVLQMLGSLTILTLFTDRARPTVGEAIGIGARGLVPYLLTQVVLVLASGVIAVLLGAAIGASGSPAVAVLVGCAALVAAIYVMVRTLLVAPVIAVEGAAQSARDSTTLVAADRRQCLADRAVSGAARDRVRDRDRVAHAGGRTGFDPARGG